ncbi:MAG: DHA2 family efflux MFS transporter permease subunit [Phycisphaerae bacterium]|nr:DHA2 family efflux MFS transporter permease subunit [Phycisphaerae bacterium]
MAKSATIFDPLNSAAKPGINPWLVALTVSLATFMEVLDTSIANVALNHIAGNLGAGQDESTWVLTSYLVSNAIIIPISGWLSSVVGRKRFYMSCVALFTISSFLCGIAPSLTWLLIFRVMQGAGGGGLAPSEQSMLADTFPPEKRGLAFAIWGVAVVVAPAIGPTLGGFITDNYSWRWIFFINIPVGVVSLFLTNLLVQDPPRAVEATKRARANGIRIDYIGFALVAIGFGALQIVLDKGQEDDWFSSRFILAVTITAVVTLLALIIWETMVVDDPIVDLPLLVNAGLSTSMVLQFIVGFILSSTTVLIPEFVQYLLGWNATQAGLVLMPGGIALIIMMPIAGQLVSRVQAKYLMAIGLSITAGSMFYLATINLGIDFRHLAWVRAFQCIGLPLFFIPLNTIAYSNLPAGKNNNASALMSLMRNLGGGIGISLAATMLTRRAQMHQTRLASHATPYSQPFVSYMQSLGGFTHRNIVGFYGMVQRQASMLAYLDVFKVFAWGTVGVIVLILMLKTARRAENPEMAMH